MKKSDMYLFASYSLKDRGTVVPFIERLRALGVNVFYDATLRPGEDWESALAVALDHAAGLLVFVSPRSMQSEWVRKEISAGIGPGSRLVIPIILEHTQDIPSELKRRQWLDLSGELSEAELETAAQHIAEAFQSLAPVAFHPADTPEPGARKAAEEFAADLRREQRPPEATSPPDSVFVVHGHDTSFLDEVETYIKERGILPVVLTQVRGASQSLFQKFLQFGREARFAIVLLSADDLGASRRQFEADGVGERALQFRARQNVILELGFFYGFLGWESVFVLCKDPSQVFPNFERPSDLDGVVFDTVDLTGEWKSLLRRRLAEAGFTV
jgi:predicted nucleotide-binding protein